MTCVWDTMLARLTPRDEAALGGALNPRTPRELASRLRAVSEPVPSQCTWCGVALSAQEREDHHRAVLAIDVSRLGDGRWVGACDSVLLLLCHRTARRIVHTTPSGVFTYDPPRSHAAAAEKSVYAPICIQSSSVHMW